MKDKGMIVSMRDTQKTKQAMDNIVKSMCTLPTPIGIQAIDLFHLIFKLKKTKTNLS